MKSYVRQDIHVDEGKMQSSATLSWVTQYCLNLSLLMSQPWSWQPMLTKYQNEWCKCPCDDRASYWGGVTACMECLQGRTCSEPARNKQYMTFYSKIQPEINRQWYKAEIRNRFQCWGKNYTKKTTKTTQPNTKKWTRETHFKMSSYQLVLNSTHGVSS